MIFLTRIKILCANEFNKLELIDRAVALPYNVALAGQALVARKQHFGLEAALTTASCTRRRTLAPKLVWTRSAYLLNILGPNNETDWINPCDSERCGP